jgi:hypothetical protein
MNFSEWWNVGVNNEIEMYAWGYTNENSWFYQTPRLYSYVMLTEAILMFLFLSLGIRELYRSKTKFSNWFYLCFAFLLIMLISGNINNF